VLFIMTSTTTSTRARLVTAAAALLLGAFATACGEKSKHATDGDTGAAAPATTVDMSATPRVGDSTTGVAKATGQAQISGDTTGSRVKGAKPAKP
jgi:hypothetical protein